MRCFIKTFTVRRHVQFSVLHDGDTAEFLVVKWAASDGRIEEIESFDYLKPDGRFSRDKSFASKEQARGQAIAAAQRLAAQEKAGAEAMTGAAIRP